MEAFCLNNKIDINAIANLYGFVRIEETLINGKQYAHYVMPISYDENRNPKTFKSYFMWSLIYERWILYPNIKLDDVVYDMIKNGYVHELGYANKRKYPVMVYEPDIGEGEKK